MVGISEGADWFRAVFDAVPDGIVVVSAAGVITDVNPRAEDLFGYGARDLIGQPVDVLLPEQRRAAHRRHRQGYAADPKPRAMGSNLDLMARTKDGREFPVDVSISPVGGAGGSVVAIVRDLTDRKAEEERLSYLAAIMESSSDAVYSQDRDGLLTTWNRAAQRLFGHRPADVIGTASTELMTERARGAFEVLQRRVAAGEPRQYLETEIRRRNGLVVPVSMTLSPIRNAAGDVVGISTIVRDLTEQNLALTTLAESEARLREGESLAHVGGWIMDAASGAVQWSEELHRIHGVHPADFEGTINAHLANVHPSERDALDATIASAITENTSFETEYRIRRDDGATRWLYCRAEPVHGTDDEVLGLRGICQDITDRRMAEEAMRDAYEKERAAVEGLRAADALKDEFLATVSHELRTPLTAILGFAHLVADADGGMPARDLAVRIERNAGQMLEMVERLLDFSRILAGKVRLQEERLSLDGLLGELADSLRQHVLDHHLEIAESGLQVVADHQAMLHILGNLVSNAAKFSPAGSVIEISAAADGEWAVVTVRDHGRGIPTELSSQVFERFFQAPGQPAGRRGAGVGLAIVRRYVELQGGRVWCEPAPGDGTMFRFTLPLSEGQP